MPGDGITLNPQFLVDCLNFSFKKKNDSSLHFACLICCVVASGNEPRDLHMVGKYSTSEQYPPFNFAFLRSQHIEWKPVKFNKNAIIFFSINEFHLQVYPTETTDKLVYI